MHIRQQVKISEDRIYELWTEATKGEIRDVGKRRVTLFMNLIINEYERIRNENK